MSLVTTQTRQALSHALPVSGDIHPIISDQSGDRPLCQGTTVCPQTLIHDSSVPRQSKTGDTRPVLML